MEIWNSALIALIGAAVTALLGFWCIPMLKKLKYGQTILDIGPAWHKNTKQGTPTMGGVMFIIGTAVAFTVGIVLLWKNGQISFDGVGKLGFQKALSGFLLAVFFGVIGFIDDFLKVRKRKNEGLTPNQKIILQIMAIAAYFTSNILSGDTRTTINFPFIGPVQFWYFYYILMGLGILYMVNAVNLTDGVDGLCSGVSVVYFGIFMIICNILGFKELGVLSVGAGGACLGFLIWNFNPAKVFMGDTGSMFLGGLVAALGVGSACEVLMVITGGIYVFEALSVIIQMTYFKLTGGKRFFKMTPIHHSLELRKWGEPKIFFLFCSITALGGILSIILLQYIL